MGCSRCYLRGTSVLGLLNTLLGCVFGIVLVKMVDTRSGTVIRWYLDKATRHPPREK